ncbi:2-polyprenyl-6-methoxyphenol hydroxylase-like FAD-dependent oxidoreductase [Geodermatophilus normandii]|uniref:2-polyprenyl-6-methoxyphenol hydroxylase-like FAD-dependent oxidoreductase n=1 Tax=Geodermatophilus normandii TaxID=1137989 RepID=A0A317QNP7_9ACTN|nr:FAD-dependent monooxygenase [Geodermatophilus normandii]PWW24386.1 2-polyprenyl-6-methoxyphenol hydroxylase-like FAD-dependent oxidoreductase [Geodermatophilus normandii]
MRVLVVGAGPAGCTAAAALAGRGAEVVLVEAQPEVRPSGPGLVLQSAPMRALDSLGLLGPCLERGHPHDGIDLCDADGTVRRTLTPPSLLAGRPASLAISRAALSEVLTGAVTASGAELRTGTTVAGLTDAGDRVEVRLSDGATETVDVVVGADGLHSHTRLTVLPGAPRPRPTGQVIWRAPAPRPPDVTRYSMLDGGPELGKVGVVPVSGAGLYVWLLEPDRGAERPPPEELTEAFRERLRPFGGPVPLVADALDGDVDVRSLQSLLVPLPWSRGRTVLVGDAVHTTTPQLAYGVGMAIEDSVVLAGMLAGVPAADDDVPAVLLRFGERRFDRCRLVVETSVRLGEWERHPPADPSLPGRLTGEVLAELARPV